MKTKKQMQPHKTYRITKRIKIHTKPLATVDVTQQGEFLKETPLCYVFSGFLVRKANMIKIEEILYKEV